MMNNDRCIWSEQEIAQSILNKDQLSQCAYVECPECGSIRAVTRRVQIGIGLGKYYHLYPVHNVLMGTARTRDQWWKLNRNSGVWSLATKEAVKS